MGLSEKKIPALDDRDGQIEVLTAGLLTCLISGGDQSYPVPLPEVSKIAALAYDCGIRQTADKAEQINVSLPGWIKEQVREQSEPVPAQPDLTAPQDTPLVGEAPKPPKRIPKKLMAQVVSD